MTRSLRNALLVAAATGLAAIGCSRTETPAAIRWQALPARPPADGALFRRLSADETGIAFRNVLRPENVRKYLYNGSGVSIGDVDGDGLPDVYLVSLDGPNRLFRQTAPWRFEDITEAAGVDGRVDGANAWGAGASFADVDGDGDLDLFVANLGARDLLYRNQGDGRFVESAADAGLDRADASVMGAFADYDRDGDLDLYLLTNRVLGVAEERPQPRLQERNGVRTVHPEDRDKIWILDGHVLEAGQKDVLYRNDGDGRFTDMSSLAGIQGYDMGLAATWWDYDADGWPDLYVSNDFNTPDRLYRNEGGGRFSEVSRDVLPHTPWFSMGADFADVDGDGLLDFLAADMSSTTHFKQKTTMGEMTASRWFLESAEPRQYMRNALYLNTGTDRFAEIAQLAGVASTDWTWAVRFADLDGDGREDLFIGNGMEQNANDSDWKARVKALREQGRDAEVAALVADIPRLPERNLAFRNAGDLRFEAVGPEWGLDLEGVSHGAAFADLDRDGDLDLVVNNMNDPVAVYRNEGATGHRLLLRLMGTRSDRWGVGARVELRSASTDQIRLLTLARGYLSSDEPLVHFGLGEDAVIEELVVRWPSGAVQRFADLPADRFYSIEEPASGDGDPQTAVAATPVSPRFSEAPGAPRFRHRERPFDDYAREPLLPAKLSQLGPGLAWGDADGDGDDDLFAGGAAGQAGALFLNRGDGRFEAATSGPWEAHAEREDMGVLWLDADGDRDLDLYVASGGVEGDADTEAFEDRLYLNGGDGHFGDAPPGTLPAARVSTGAVAACDVDRDGDLDLFTGGRIVPGRYPYGPGSQLLRNDGGRFADATDDLAPELARLGMVTGAVWSDADGDGGCDLLVTEEWGPVHFFRNADGRLVDATAASGLADRRGWWNGIAAGDLDGDGDMDYVATNVGLNTKYAASAEAPVRLYAGDFDDSGGLDLVEANFEEHSEYPVRGLSCSSDAMPFVREEFDSFAAFASATLPEIYGDRGLDRALTLEADTLESVALLNDGSGRFELRPLPRLAQAAPGYGAAVRDFDGDGSADVALAQNSFAPQPETGRMDGGLSLLLRGRGDGDFDPVRADASGIVVSGDAKALAVSDVDGDGWPDLTIGVNDGALRSFRNRGGDGTPIVLRLAGLPGNPTGVGARVTTETDSGRRHTAEVRAGGGYLSQSSAAIPVALTPGETLRAVDVRWPDGRETRFETNLAGPTVLLTEPPR